MPNSGTKKDPVTKNMELREIIFKFCGFKNSLSTYALLRIKPMG